MSEDVNKKFADTVLKTNNGELLSLYHWTDARFTKFKKGDIGFHFGTLDTAYNRYKDIIDKRRTGESFYKESYVNIKNPVMINFDPMSWTVFPTAYKLNEQGIISNKDIAELEKLDGYTHTKYDSPAAVELRRILARKGYDGIIYSNGIEGDLSVIAFNDDQIYTVAENGIDIASGSNDADKSKLKYSDRDADSFSDRSLLANALEGVAQNDVERQKIAEYRANIANYEAQQKKLSELKRQIKEMSFAKGPRDKDAITKLRIEATKTENRINIYDKRLLGLESTKALKDVLEREKAKAYKRAEDKGRELLRAQREKADAKLTATVERYQESRRISTEGRKKTEERHKILHVVNELNQLLTKNTKDKHVPMSLKKPVADSLSVINMDTVGAEERIAKKYAEMREAKSLEEMQRLKEEIDRIEERDGKMKDKLATLKAAYDSILKSDDPLIKESYDDQISDTIAKVIEVVGETSIRDMSLFQLEAVYKMYRMILKRVRDANKAFKIGKAESITELAESAMSELDAQEQRNKYVGKIRDLINSFDWNNQKPIYAFLRLKSPTLLRLYNNVRRGEDVWALDISEAAKFFDEQKKKHGFKKWDFNKTHSFTSSTGREFKLDLGQIMSVYALSKRKQADDHLRIGGFVFDETTEIKGDKGKTYKLKDSTAYKLNKEKIAEIVGTLTEEQIAFVDETQAYLSDVMAEKGNEITRVMYDVELFGEKNYFPLLVAGQYLERKRDQANGDVKIKNKGFSKETTPNANAPVVISSFPDVWAEHVNEMSMYHAFVLPLEDFYRVYNYQTVRSETSDLHGVIPSIDSSHGNGASKYIDQLLKDINGGAVGDPRETFAKKTIANFKKAAVMASMSVVVQQPTSIVRAMALIDPKYFTKVQKLPRKKHKAKWEEIKKYAPVAIIKEIGSFDTGTGRGAVEWLKGEKTFFDKADDFISKAPALADEITWCAIWDAVKRETLVKHQDLSPTSEKLLRLAGERFTEVITMTQVYDSTLSRSAFMRSKSTYMAMATSFMAESTTALNMLEYGLFNKKVRTRMWSATYGSILFNAVVVSLVYAMRDDDEDETFIEKYLSSLTGEVVDGINPLTMMPFIKDIWSIFQGYDVERADMSLVSDLGQSIENLTRTIRKGENIVEAISDLLGSVSSLFGVPLKNVTRDVKAIINAFLMSWELPSGSDVGAGVYNSVKNQIPIWNYFPNMKK